LALVAAMVALAGCATTPPPEVRMIPTADHGVGARFSRDNALMVSNGPSSAIMLLPVRYNDTQKFFFSIAAFNTSGYPINIGSEDVRLYLDGQPYRVQDFNYLRHSARTTAQREMNLAWADAAVEYFLTLQEGGTIRAATTSPTAAPQGSCRRRTTTSSDVCADHRHSGPDHAGDDDHRPRHAPRRRHLGGTDGSTRQPGGTAGSGSGPKRKKPHGWKPWGFRRSEPSVRM
jgi:hypothetical protein